MPEENTRHRVPLKIILFTVLPILLLLLLAILSYFSGIELQPTSDNQNNKKTDISANDSSEINPNKEYNNPFEKDTQYINPFSEYRNPFDQ